MWGSGGNGSDSVHATDAITTVVLKVDILILRQSPLPKVGSILFVPQAFIAAALESVLVVKDALLM